MSNDRRHMNDSISRLHRLHESTIKQGDRSFVRRLSMEGVPDRMIELRLASTSRMPGDRLTYAMEMVGQYRESQNNSPSRGR